MHYASSYGQFIAAKQFGPNVVCFVVRYFYWGNQRRSFGELVRYFSWGNQRGASGGTNAAHASPCPSDKGIQTQLGEPTGASTAAHLDIR